MTTATYRVLVGDALEQLQTLPDASVDLCVTSPPYGDLIVYGLTKPVGPAEYADWLLPVIQEITRVLAPGGVFALAGGPSSPPTPSRPPKPGRPRPSPRSISPWL